MGKRRVRKATIQSLSAKTGGDQTEESFQDHEVEQQIAAIRALRDLEIEQLRTMLKLVSSYFSKEQLQVPVLQFFKEKLPNLSIADTWKECHYEVQWKDKDNLVTKQADEGTILHASLLHQLSIAYPDYTTGIQSVSGFEFSNRSGIGEPSDYKIPELKDGLRTPDVSNNRLSVGMTPKTLRLPKPGEMLLSVHGSPLGVYKEDNMETIQEADDD